MTAAAEHAGRFALPGLSWPVAALQAAAGVALSAVLFLLLLRLFRARLPGTARPPRSVLDLGARALLLYFAAFLASGLLFGLLSGAKDSARARDVELGLVLTTLVNAALIAGVLAYGRLRLGLRPRDLGLAAPRPAGLFFAVLAVIAAWPAFHGASLVNAKLVELYGWEPFQEVIQSLLDDPGLRSNPLVLLGIVVLIPLLEEILFRGLVQRALRAVLGPAPAIAAASLVFAVVHDVQSSLPVFFVGAALGIVCEATGSVLAAAFAHSAFNGFMVACILAFSA
ncbi:MAG: CPBP family intramembrane metalloprotease [Planctomycetes bacterium]|nr:CPBP family intramembrane metalloprotease [Planctomycetota bacterium]